MLNIKCSTTVQRSKKPIKQAGTRHIKAVSFVKIRAQKPGSRPEGCRSGFEAGLINAVHIF